MKLLNMSNHKMSLFCIKPSTNKSLSPYIQLRRHDHKSRAFYRKHFHPSIVQMFLLSCCMPTLHTHLALLNLENRAVTTALVPLACSLGILALPMPPVAPKRDTKLLRAQAVLTQLNCSQTPARDSPWSCLVLQGLGGSGRFATSAWSLCHAQHLLHLQHGKLPCGKSTHSLPISQEKTSCMCFP